MTVKELVEKFDLKVFNDEVDLNREIIGAYVSDLLSDVMGFAKESQVWITLQTHKNTIAIASLKDLAAVVLIKDLEPDADALQAAINEDIPVLGTSEQCFEFCGKLYASI